MKQTAKDLFSPQTTSLTINIVFSETDESAVWFSGFSEPTQTHTHKPDTTDAAQQGCKMACVLKFFCCRLFF